jgi:hypothetical protein
MKHNFKELIKKVPFPLILIFIIIAPFYLILGCPIQFFTGISCMGCGMSRAAVALLQLDFSLAFHMHPLIFIMPIVALIIIFRKKIPKNVMITLCVIGAVLMIGTYIYRIVTGSDVIYIEPENGFFYKIITYIFNKK